MDATLNRIQRQNSQAINETPIQVQQLVEQTADTSKVANELGLQIQRGGY